MTGIRRVAVGVAAVVGLLTGVALTLAATEPTHEAGGNPVRDTATPSTVARAGPPEKAPPSTADEPGASDVLLVWTSGGLAPGFGDLVSGLDGVEELTLVTGDQADMVRTMRRDGATVDRVDAGWAIPLDTIAVDPTTFAGFVDPSVRSTVAALRPGDALLTETSRELRRLDVGSTIELAGGSVRVAGTIDDRSGAGAELLVHAADADRLQVATPRYALLRHRAGMREVVTDAVAAVADDRPIRFRTPVETTWLRHGDAVAPQVFIKRDFGEFAYRDRSDRDVEIDPAWVESSIAEAQVPILGTVRCHVAALEPLRQALGQLADDNLGHLVDAGGFAGCWSPRRIAAGEALSRHAWGIAVDLNIEDNPRGSFSTQDPRLVEAMRAAGFTWGGLWLFPDPGHYELVPA